jgi:methylthioribose-1-phosphate isomerase
MRQRPIWLENGRVYLIDQTVLPGRHETLEMTTPERMWQAIKRLEVRGAPAIGIAALLGVWLAVRDLGSGARADATRSAAMAAADYLATARPTAVNLFWALERAKSFFAHLPEDGTWAQAYQSFCQSVINEDDAACREIGRLGAELLPDGSRILTHCNAGALATAGWGTATAPVYYAREVLGRNIAVYADETRPLLQGARLTAWELAQAGVDVTLICDNMAGTVMARGFIDAVIVGTDRVAANGDFANKIGTYGVAVLAREHGIPFYVAAPTSSIDHDCPSGGAIPIEERDPAEVTGFGGRTVAPLEGVKVFNPAFDVTPARYVTAFLTEKGVVRAPFAEGLAALRTGETT